MARMPQQVRPMFCTLVDEAPSGEGWMFETKWDGERCVAFVRKGKKPEVRLQSRILRDETVRYPELVLDLGRVDAKEAIIDGEIVALDEKGAASFEALQRRFGLTDEGDIARRMAETPASYAAFDLLWLDGKDLRERPLAERRKLLKKILRRCRRTAFSRDYDDAGALMAVVKSAGSEGIVAKRVDGAYKEGARGREWLKIKVTASQEVVIGGWTEGTGRRSTTFGALVIGVYERGRGRPVLAHVGSVGTGFDEASLADMLRRLRKLETKTCPFAEKPMLRGAVHWVRPRLVAQVKFANWTGGGQLRAPVFLGLRNDKKPEDCVREKPRRTRR